MREPFARATKSILRRIGKDALLRGAPAGYVNVEHGVEVYMKGHDEVDAVFSRSVATIEKAYAPVKGDLLELRDDTGAVVERYTVDALFADNGHSVRHIVMVA